MRAPAVLWAAGTVGRADRPVASIRENLITAGLAGVLVAGGYIDTWGHTRNAPETFFTIWHLLVYTGYFATALWILSLCRRYGAVPVGYGIGLGGLATFLVGGVGDLAWHELAGFDVGLEGVLSPTHILLFVGVLLIVSTPLQAAWLEPSSRAESHRSFLPTLLSGAQVIAIVALFLKDVSPFWSTVGGRSTYQVVTSGADRPTVAATSRLLQLHGYESILLTTLIIMVPTLLLCRRWPLPFGSVTLFCVAVAVPVAALISFNRTACAAVAAGLAGDLVLPRLRRQLPPRPTILVLGAVVPLVMWSSYFAVVARVYGLVWSLRIWSGMTCMAALTGLGVAVLLTIPPVSEPQPSSQRYSAA